ncbi:MAG: nucleotidyltransferase [Acidobacteriota bacterium]|jgi:hypothetical protein|nr:nucleotidyltransferase [Acidobacteriota bacterium]
MTKKKIYEILEKRNAGKRDITTAQGIEAVLSPGEIAEENQIKWAIAGGIAIQIYGFTRATTDVDAIASGILPIDEVKELTFGGVSYLVLLDDEEITVNWIVRDDSYDDFYQAALEDAVEIEEIKIVSPEWLAILKHLANRGKDELDLMWFCVNPIWLTANYWLNTWSESVGNMLNRLLIH